MKYVFLLLISLSSSLFAQTNELNKAPLSYTYSDSVVIPTPSSLSDRFISMKNHNIELKADVSDFLGVLDSLGKGNKRVRDSNLRNTLQVLQKTKAIINIEELNPGFKPIYNQVFSILLSNSKAAVSVDGKMVKEFKKRSYRGKSAVTLAKNAGDMKKGQEWKRELHGEIYTLTNGQVILDVLHGGGVEKVTH